MRSAWASMEPWGRDGAEESWRTMQASFSAIYTAFWDSVDSSLNIAHAGSHWYVLFVSTCLIGYNTRYRSCCISLSGRNVPANIQVFIPDAFASQVEAKSKHLVACARSIGIWGFLYFPLKRMYHEEIKVTWDVRGTFTAISKHIKAMHAASGALTRHHAIASS